MVSVLLGLERVVAALLVGGLYLSEETADEDFLVLVEVLRAFSPALLVLRSALLPEAEACCCGLELLVLLLLCGTDVVVFLRARGGPELELLPLVSSETMAVIGAGGT